MNNQPTIDNSREQLTQLRIATDSIQHALDPILEDRQAEQGHPPKDPPRPPRGLPTNPPVVDQGQHIIHYSDKVIFLTRGLYNTTSVFVYTVSRNRAHIPARDSQGCSISRNPCNLCIINQPQIKTNTTALTNSSIPDAVPNSNQRSRTNQARRHSGKQQHHLHNPITYEGECEDLGFVLGLRVETLLTKLTYLHFVEKVYFYIISSYKDGGQLHSLSTKLTNPLAISVLEGIALVGNPNFVIIDEACPYTAQKLMTDDSPHLKKLLSHMVYGKEGRTLDAQNLIDLLHI